MSSSKRFSQRIGAVLSGAPFQIDEVRDELRASLWNVVFVQYLDDVRSHYSLRSTSYGGIARLCHIHFFRLPIDEIPDSGEDYLFWLKKWFFDAKWFEVYDFVEWLGDHGSIWESWTSGNPAFEKAQKFRSTVNVVLARENAAYRFANSQLVPITNEQEVLEIERAGAQQDGYSAVGNHISTAIKLLSDRVNPDYRNSIKESISAVEAAARMVTGDPKATLGDALRGLGRDTGLHPALKDGFSKLYGWSNDAEGIRHAMMDMSSVTMADARFMLVACSAFANYLIDRTKSS